MFGRRWLFGGKEVPFINRNGIDVASSGRISSTPCSCDEEG
jgi:hypothetical protein